MRNTPWKMKEGFLIGGGLIIAGLALELTIGAVNWSAFSWPVNGIVLSGLLVMLAVMTLLYNKVYAIRYLCTYQAAIPTMVYAVVLTIIMGLTRQTDDGTWLNNMLTFWPFVLIYVFIAIILGLITLRRLGRLRYHFGLRDASFLLNHLGLFMAMVCATLGNADIQRLKLTAIIDEPEWRAIDQEQRIVELPFMIQLDKFIMETYDDGSPRRFASEIHLITKSKDSIQATIDVNKPAEIDGWKIYQYSYDTTMGPMSQISIFELVRDPWLPWVYAGIFMMLGGAASMFILAQRKK